MSSEPSTKDAKKMSIAELFKGNATKDYLVKKWMPISALIFWGCMLISYLLYPGEDNFSIMTHSISFLGDWIDNPMPGWLFFTIAMIVGGIVFMPVGMYMYRRFKVCNNILGRFTNFLYILGCFGIILVGIFADVGSVDLYGLRVSDYHNVAAVLGFGGLGLAIIEYSYLNIRDKSKLLKGKNLMKSRNLFVPHIPLIIGLIGMIVSQGLRLLWGYDDFPGPGFLSFTFWEWMLLIGIWLYHFLIIPYLPEKPTES
jgi:Protein of unknown function (DUF998)